MKMKEIARLIWYLLLHLAAVYTVCDVVKKLMAR